MISSQGFILGFIYIFGDRKCMFLVALVILKSSAYDTIEQRIRLLLYQ